MIEGLAKITEEGTIMIYAYNEEDEQFLGLVKHLESIEVLGRSWYLHLPDGQTLWADKIGEY